MFNLSNGKNMYCKHHGKEIADSSTFCQYYDGKQDVIDTTSNNEEEIKLGSFYDKDEPKEEVMVYDDPEPSNSFISSNNTKSNVLEDIDDNKEYTLEELNNYIKDGVEMIQKMANDFPCLTRFSHYSQFAAVLTPAGLLGSLRESIQTKRLMKYLDTKIYNNMSYDSLGFYMANAAENLSKAQAKVQKMVTPANPVYFENVRAIIDSLLKYHTEWKEVAPEVYGEELTLKSGEKFYLGIQMEYEMHKFFTQMELPEGEYKEIQKNVKNADNEGSGCMVFIGSILTASLMTACSLLNG